MRVIKGKREKRKENTFKSLFIASQEVFSFLSSLIILFQKLSSQVESQSDSIIVLAKIADGRERAVAAY